VYYTIAALLIFDLRNIFSGRFFFTKKIAINAFELRAEYAKLENDLHLIMLFVKRFNIRNIRRFILRKNVIVAHRTQYPMQKFYTLYIYLGTLYYCNNARTLNVVIKLGIV
jgi:hypothetical protein